MSHDIENLWFEYSKEITDSPFEFHTWTLLSAVGTLLGNKVWLENGANRLYPNLWQVIIAPSSAFRKSTVLNIARKFLVEIDPNLIYPQEYSAEKLISIFSKQPFGLLLNYEFATFIGVLNKEYNSGLRGALTELFDSPERYQRKTNKETLTVEKPAISILAASTKEWLMESIKENDFKAGFLSRFIYIPVTEKQIFYHRARKHDFLKFQEISHILQKYIVPSEREITINEDADHIFASWVHKNQREMTERDVPLLDSYFFRLEGVVLKICLIEAILEASEAITAPIMESAITKVNWLKAAMVKFYNQGFIVNPLMKQKEGIKRLLSRSNGTGVLRSELLKQSHLEKRYFDQLIDTMIESEEIITEFLNHPKRKPSKVYKIFTKSQDETPNETLISQEETF